MLWGVQAGLGLRVAGQALHSCLKVHSSLAVAKLDGHLFGVYLLDGGALLLLAAVEEEVQVAAAAPIVG